MRNTVERLFASGIRLLLPPHCLCCGNRMAETHAPQLLCETCRNTIFVENWAFCPRCGSSSRITASGTPACKECRKRRFRFDGVVPLGVYDGLLRDCVLRMKRASETPLSRSVAELFCASRSDALRGLDVEGVVATPMHWLRRLRRGTNSPAIIAERIALTLKVPNISKSVFRRRKTRPQAGLTPTKRRDNVRNAFCVKSSRYVKGKRLLLVDDILTTGATCHEIAKVLKKAGAAKVFVAVLARAEGPTSRSPN